MGLHKMKIEVLMEERFIVKLITTLCFLDIFHSMLSDCSAHSFIPARQRVHLFRGGKRATKESELIEEGEEQERKPQKGGHVYTLYLPCIFHIFFKALITSLFLRL